MDMPPATCISDEVHDRRPGCERMRLTRETYDSTHVASFVSHYFGCVPFCERQVYFDLLGAEDQERIRDELRRVDRLKKFVESYALDKQSSSTSGKGRRGKALATNVKTSLSLWRHFREDDQDAASFRSPIQAYHKELHPWHEDDQTTCATVERHDPIRQGLSTPGQPPSLPRQTTETPYEVERDFKGYLVQYKLDGTATGPVYTSDHMPDATGSVQDDESNLSETEKMEREKTKIWKGQFPSQKATVHDLLSRPLKEGIGIQDSNYLLRDGCGRSSENPKNILRYFHFPANNMTWVEEAIARYYGETLRRDGENARWRPEQQGREAANAPSKTGHLLHDELWKGLQHGDEAASYVHSRHLRPLCELIHSPHEQSGNGGDGGPEDAAKNLILLMPMLHWETDRKRSTFARAIDQLSAQEQQKRIKKHNDATWGRRNKREQYLYPPKLNAPSPSVNRDGRRERELQRAHAMRAGVAQEPVPDVAFETALTSIEAVVLGKMDRSRLRSYYYQRSSGFGSLSRHKDGRFRFRHPLAQLLYDSSCMMEAMENHRDTMLLETYLFKDSPLHPRRTLDQAYYCSLRNTKSRDRDQVVYRETTPKAEGFHAWEHREDGTVMFACQQDADHDGGARLGERRKLATASTNLYSESASRLRCRRCPKCYTAKKHPRDWLGKPQCPSDKDHISTDEEDFFDSEEDDYHGRDGTGPSSTSTETGADSPSPNEPLQTSSRTPNGSPPETSPARNVSAAAGASGTPRGPAPQTSPAPAASGTETTPAPNAPTPGNPPAPAATAAEALQAPNAPETSGRRTTSPVLDCSTCKLTPCYARSRETQSRRRPGANRGANGNPQASVRESLKGACRDKVLERRCSQCQSAGIGCGCYRSSARRLEEGNPPVPQNASLPGSRTGTKTGPSATTPSTTPSKEQKGEYRRCPSCRDNICKLSRVIMVDQLWMWILDEHTILTFFPRRYGFNRHDVSGVHNAIRRSLENAKSHKIGSVFDIALIILTECTKIFFDRKKTIDRQPRVLDMFSEAIGRVTYKQTLAFEHLWHSADELRKRSAAGSKGDLSGMHVPLLNIVQEGKLQREIKDILDELGILIHLVTQQKDVLEQFQRNVVQIMSVPLGDDGNTQQVITMTPQGGLVATPASPEKTRLRQRIRKFEASSGELIRNVCSHLSELESLRQSATSTSVSLDHLLTLKQQQASVIQAWQSINQGEEAVKQGRAIMVFTTMTIIFLPLAFVAAIFGMNNADLDPEYLGGLGIAPMSMREQLRLMFAISIAVIVVSLVLAFSPLTRAFIFSLSQRMYTWILTRFWVYRAWIRVRHHWASDTQFRDAEEYATWQKQQEGRAKRRRIARKLDEEYDLSQKRKAKKKKAKQAHKKKSNGETTSSQTNGGAATHQSGNGRNHDQHQDDAGEATVATGAQAPHGGSSPSDGSSGTQPPPTSSTVGIGGPPVTPGGTAIRRPGQGIMRSAGATRSSSTVSFRQGPVRTA